MGELKITGHIRVGEKSFVINSKSWLSFMMEINQMMRESEITFPLGEDEKMRMVTRKTHRVERFKS